MRHHEFNNFEINFYILLSTVGAVWLARLLTILEHSHIKYLSGFFYNNWTAVYWAKKFKNIGFDKWLFLLSEKLGTLNIVFILLFISFYSKNLSVEEFLFFFGFRKIRL
jgi:hypothetical protein